jgi:hypothetical protein
MAAEIEEPPVNQPKNTPKVSDIPSSYRGATHLHQIQVRPCDKNGNIISPNDPLQIVVGFLVNGDQSIDSQYSTPFENSNPEHRLPTLLGQLQSGGWVDTANSIASALPFVDGLSAEQKASLSQLEGRSSLTKVNSTQIFVSTQPITLSLTLFFDAWDNPELEVEEMLKRLQQWALPKSLSEGSLVNNVFSDGLNLESLFPSEVPPYLCLSFGNKRYAPMLIQSLSMPIGGVPINKNGARMHCQVQANFVSRTAWDQLNINSTYQGGAA